MNATHNLRICFMILFLLCISRGGDLWAQNLIAEDTPSVTAIPSVADSLLVEQLCELGLPLYSITTQNRVEPPFIPKENSCRFARMPLSPAGATVLPQAATF